MDFATKDNGSGYLYTVRVKGDDPNKQYHEGMSNMSFAQIDNLEITKVDEMIKFNPDPD